MFEQIVTMGLLALFGGLLLWVPIGLLVGRFRGFEAGVGTGMMLFGLTGLGAGGVLAWYLFQASEEHVLLRRACEAVEVEDAGSVPYSRDEFELVVPDGRRLRLEVEPYPGRCSDRADDEPVRLRVARAALAVPGDAPVAAERIVDPRQGVGLIGVFGAFGGFGLLGGGVITASAFESRRTREPTPVSPGRAQLATALTTSGHFVLIGCLAIPWVLGWETERAVHYTFRGVAIACACWWAATVAGGRHSLAQTLFFLLMGGGFYLAALSVKFFA
ncbi:MAG: hypothetical protein KF788_00295 [Piscinibacter sp.]|nr:hypothetical protein [Piscinibacter sp.]